MLTVTQTLFGDLTLSPSLCQSVVAEVQNKLVERVWLDLSHLLFLLLHNFHRGFLQFHRYEQLALPTSNLITNNPFHDITSQHSFKRKKKK